MTGLDTIVNNSTIQRINTSNSNNYWSYPLQPQHSQMSINAEESANAKKEGRLPLILPKISAHHLRHTFCTRLCENETNIKVIQSIMGHKDIQTTLDIYADCTEEKKKEVIHNMEGKIFIM